MTSVAFQSILRKQIRKLPKILKSVKIIQYCSILFNRLLSQKFREGHLILLVGNIRGRERAANVVVFVEDHLLVGLLAVVFDVFQ